MKMQTNDLTKGSPVKVILLFALPVLAGNVFQQMYNVIDTVIVGHVLGDNALAAVGATGSVYSFIISFINGVCNGFSIIIARYFGAKNEMGLKKATACAITLGLVLTVLFTGISLAVAKPLLVLLNTPPNILDQAYSFIRVLFSCMLFTMLYNLAAGLLRALGNTRLPLVFLVLAMIMNIFLDLFFVGTLKFGVAGAAWATVLSQLFSVVLCFIYILRKCPMLHVTRSDFRIKKKLAAEMAATGFSIGFSLSIVQIGSVTLQSAINGFGQATMTAHMAARKIGEMCMLPMGTMGIASATFASQNMGAGKIDRIKKGMKNAVALSWCWAVLVNVVVFSAGGLLIQLLTGTKDPYIVKTAVMYMRINMPFYFVLGMLFTYRQTLQGVGSKLAPIFSSCIELGGKILVTFSLAPILGYLGVCVAEPIIWVACTVLLIVQFHSKIRTL